MLKKTNDSHFNPCFWTALWNDAYLDPFIQGRKPDKPPRDHLVWCYNLIAGRILRTKASSIHKHNGLGFAEFTHSSALRLRNVQLRAGFSPPQIRKRHFVTPLYIDTEDLFSGLESTSPYRAVLEVVRTGEISDAAQQSFLAAFFVIHDERVRAAWKAQPTHKQHHLEHIISLKHRLGDKKYLYDEVSPLMHGAWYAHEFSESVLLLGDFGFPVVDGRFMAALSPRHLIVIDANRSMPAHLIPSFESGDLQTAGIYNAAVVRISKYEIVGPRDTLLKIH